MIMEKGDERQATYHLFSNNHLKVLYVDSYKEDYGKWLLLHKWLKNCAKKQALE